MQRSTRRIGLSLGADICWPGAYEQLVRKLNLELTLGDEVVDFAVERVMVEPYSLRQPCRYDVVLDRLTHWFHTSREWIKKSVIMDSLYVLNNPWSLQSMEKHTSYCAMMKLGLPVPETWMLPPKAGPDHEDSDRMLRSYGQLFDLNRVGEAVGYPNFIKPYDGGGWRGVSRVKSGADLKKAYDASGQSVMHVQQSIEDYDLFVRTIGIGPQVEVVRYDPTAPLHARYVVDYFFVDGPEWKYLVDQMMTINGFFGWDFNSCESLRRDGTFYPIDFANACPDFQVTSLHYHWPSLVKNMVRWSLFCAATKRKVNPNLNWEPYFEIARKDLPFRERLAGYAAISRERMEVDRFREFCETHLSHLDEVAQEFFGSPAAKKLVHDKVSALYPAHEIEQFTEHFWGLIQFWRKTDADRLERQG
jgi:hypothetical protein